MIKNYPLEWLETLILQTLNAADKKIMSISEQDLSLLCQDVLNESNKIQVQIKNEVFAAQNKRQIRLLINKYYSCFVFLKDHLMQKRRNEILKSDRQSKIIDTALSSLDELLFFTETRFTDFLSLDQRVSLSYVLVFRKEILLRLKELKDKKKANEKNSQIIEIVFAALSDSVLNESQCMITYRKMFYQKTLLKQLETVTDMQECAGVFWGIDRVLIEMNFNDHRYINYLIDQIQQFIVSQDSLIDQLIALSHYYKEFSQLPSNKKISFCPDRENIKDFLENWLGQEIVYLEKKLELSLKTNSADLKALGYKTLLNDKIECDLSADQIALILRATDESRVIKARSMNYFFKMIVPHLSTPFKKDLSYHSVRSKSYTPEDRDKEITIQTLERIIKKIKSY